MCDSLTYTLLHARTQHSPRVPGTLFVVS